jgi:predicted KAP-like P-loop ATPase
MRKIRKVSVRLTDAEVKFIDAIARSRRVSFSEALRWLVHQSLLLSLLEAPQIKTARDKLLKTLENSVSSLGKLLLGAKSLRNNTVIMFYNVLAFQ